MFLVRCKRDGGFGYYGLTVGKIYIVYAVIGEYDTEPMFLMFVNGNFVKVETSYFEPLDQESEETK